MQLSTLNQAANAVKRRPRAIGSSIPWISRSSPLPNCEMTAAVRCVVALALFGVVAVQAGRLGGQDYDKNDYIEESDEGGDYKNGEDGYGYAYGKTLEDGYGKVGYGYGYDSVDGDHTFGSGNYEWGYEGGY
ncbi:hypothetical protein AAVH_18105 [Aphelenchoides avenae]|nr:hypothetical protein AAVH_18105 [Aphelenchus avenae]